MADYEPIGIENPVYDEDPVDLNENAGEAEQIQTEAVVHNYNPNDDMYDQNMVNREGDQMTTLQSQRQETDLIIDEMEDKFKVKLVGDNKLLREKLIKKGYQWFFIGPKGGTIAITNVDGTLKELRTINQKSKEFSQYFEEAPNAEEYKANIDTWQTNTVQVADEDVEGAIHVVLDELDQGQLTKTTAETDDPVFNRELSSFAKKYICEKMVQ